MKFNNPTNQNVDLKNDKIKASSLPFGSASCDSESDSAAGSNPPGNWTENPAYCAPKRKVKINMTVLESPNTVRRKKYKINVKADDEAVQKYDSDLNPLNEELMNKSNVPLQQSNSQSNVKEPAQKSNHQLNLPNEEPSKKSNNENVVDTETAKLVQNLKERLKTFDEDLDRVKKAAQKINDDLGVQYFEPTEKSNNTHSPVNSRSNVKEAAQKYDSDLNLSNEEPSKKSNVPLQQSNSRSNVKEATQKFNNDLNLSNEQPSKKSNVPLQRNNSLSNVKKAAQKIDVANEEPKKESNVPLHPRIPRSNVKKVAQKIEPVLRHKINHDFNVSNEEPIKESNVSHSPHISRSNSFGRRRDSSHRRDSSGGGNHRWQDLDNKQIKSHLKMTPRERYDLYKIDR